jgi:putative DNA primase/helicase
MDSNPLGLRFNNPQEDVYEMPEEEQEVYYPETVMGVQTICASDIPVEPLVWLWKNWLAEGKLHILAGVGKVGKTTLALRLAATISTGGSWPDGSEAERGSVLIWSGEDQPGDTLVPRLKVIGANTDRIHFLDHVLDQSGKRPFNPATDFTVLSEKLTAIRDCKLLIIDPIVSTIKGNANHNNDVRQSLEPIIRLASEHKVAVIGITHLTKNSGESTPLDQVTGSLAFTAAARFVWIAASGYLEGEKVKVFSQVASNLGKEAGSFFYETGERELPETKSEYSYIKWGGPISDDVSDLLKRMRVRSEYKSKTDEAADRIRELLADGPKDSETVKKTLSREDYSKGTIDSAKKIAGVQAVKSPSSNGPWMWQLASKNPNQYRRTQDPDVGIFD